MYTHLLPSRMHDLIVHPAVHFPVPRLRRVRRKQVARRIRVHAVDRRVEDTRALESTRLAHSLFQGIYEETMCAGDIRG